MLDLASQAQRVLEMSVEMMENKVLGKPLIKPEHTCTVLGPRRER